MERKRSRLLDFKEKDLNREGLQKYGLALAESFASNGMKYNCIVLAEEVKNITTKTTCDLYELMGRDEAVSPVTYRWNQTRGEIHVNESFKDLTEEQQKFAMAYGAIRIRCETDFEPTIEIHWSLKSTKSEIEKFIKDIANFTPDGLDYLEKLSS